jgi:ParB/RepB/Spo0J family partition protein
LEASIKKHGILQPIVVGADDEVVIGQRRADVAKRLGLTPPIVRRADLNSPITKLLARLSEELSHQPMMSLERAEAMKTLWELVQRQNPKVTRVGLAKDLGVSVFTVENYLRLANVSPDITAYVGETLSPRAALEIAEDTHLNHREKVALAKKVAQEKAPGGKNTISDKVLPFLREASPQAKEAFFKNPRVTYDETVEAETRKARREATRASGANLDNLGIISQRITAKFETFEAVTRAMREENLFPVLDPFYKPIVRRLMDAIERDFEAMRRGKAEAPPSERKLAGLLDKTEAWNV